jgi:hypothetical protein
MQRTRAVALALAVLATETLAQARVEVGDCAQKQLERHTAIDAANRDAVAIASDAIDLVCRVSTALIGDAYDASSQPLTVLGSAIGARLHVDSAEPLPFGVGNPLTIGNADPQLGLAGPEPGEARFSPTLSPTLVPEPQALMLVALGLAMLARRPLPPRRSP